MDSKDKTESPAQDPSEYLFKKTEYHDCHLMVGNPDTEEVVRFGVATCQLVAHSTVFREMLLDSELADPTGANTHITDVSPHVFKLMLIHMYGGQLPNMTRDTAAQLTLCADKYNIRPLLRITTAKLTPITVDQVFPALLCVVYINLPKLSRQVTKIIQEQTPQVVRSKEFLDLDDNCIEFIVKQEKLAITELELWKSLVTWAKHQTSEQSNMRKILRKPLKHLRFLTLSLQEIVKEVMSANVLSDGEIMDLLSAVGNKRTPKMPDWCVSLEKRAFFTKVSQIKTSPANSQKYLVQKKTLFKNIRTFDIKPRFRENMYIHELETTSNFKIITSTNNIELTYFYFQSLSFSRNEKVSTYNYTCLITVRTVEGGYCRVAASMTAQGTVVCDENVAMPLMLTNGQQLILKANTSYDISLQFSPPHLTYEFYSECFPTHEERSTFENIKIKFTTPFHLTKIDYKY